MQVKVSGRISMMLDIAKLTQTFELFKGKANAKENVGGPVMIVALVSKMVTEGIKYFLHLAGVISICIAFFNLLPIPVLDGGHIMFLGLDYVLEKTRGNPLAEKTKINIQWIFINILIIFMVCMTIWDIIRLN